MKKLIYGAAPELVSMELIYPKEMMFYLYLPVRMVGSTDLRIPKRLEIFRPLITRAILHEEAWGEVNYVYLSAKRLFVTGDNPGNRPGIHSDGFLSDDVNYIWYDSMPTVFYVQNFDIEADHKLSLLQMEAQAKEESIVAFAPKNLIRIDQRMIHRCPTVITPDFRTFVKISFSKHKYNLEGNSHNHLFHYDWGMYNREATRNHPALGESDFMPEKNSHSEEYDAG